MVYFFILRVNLLFYYILKYIKTKISFFVGLKNMSWRIIRSFHHEKKIEKTFIPWLIL